MTRTRRIARIERETMERENLRDRLSDLPDCVMLHIMKFLNAKHAVQTCVLSKRWMDLWKHLTNLTFHYSGFRRIPVFDNFVHSFLSCRDDSISLHNLNFRLDFRRKGRIGPNILNEIMTYAASHDVQQLKIIVGLGLKQDFELPPCIFNCRSLKFLKLDFSSRHYSATHIKLPKSFDLPTLESLHISDVTFSTYENGCVEPFSSCNMLNTLVIDGCYFLNNTEVFYISNSKLSSLTIIMYGRNRKTYKITLSTPNLSVLTIKGLPNYQLSSLCNIPCLEEVNLDVSWIENIPPNRLVLISWLQVFANVKIVTLSWSTIKTLNAYLSSFRTQLPSFVRLKSLKLKMESFSTMSDAEVRKMMEYLLHNSPPNSKVDVIKCCASKGV